MVLTLTPETEARLRSVAHQRGLAPEATLEAVLAEAEDREMQEELRASVADYAAGRSMTLDEYRAKALARRQKREGQPSRNESAIFQVPRVAGDE